MAKIKKTVKAKPVNMNTKELAMKLQAIDQVQTVIELEVAPLLWTESVTS